MSKALGSPVLIIGHGSLALERVKLGEGLYDENWLQGLIFDHPEILPIAQIEPGFGIPVPAAREVVCGHGQIDNLYLTPEGEIVLVETKLWRNAQARREVVAQALDYVAALMGMGYEAFEAAVCKAGSVKRLHDLVAERPDALEEAAFIDAVARNLALGRMLVVVLGDGIRQESEALASLLQSHAGAHFTFALVELAMWREAVSGQILAVPHTLAQTVLIERGILRIADGVPLIQAVPVSAGSPKAYTLSEEKFYEALAQVEPGLPSHIRAFLALVAPLGVEADHKASLNLKVEVPGLSKPSLNLGSISKAGKLNTGPLSWTQEIHAFAQTYNAELGALIGGQVAASGSNLMLTLGKTAPPVSALLPEHAEGWKAAIERLLVSVRKIVTEDTA